MQLKIVADFCELETLTQNCFIDLYFMRLLESCHEMYALSIAKLMIEKIFKRIIIMHVHIACVRMRNCII